MKRKKDQEVELDEDDGELDEDILWAVAEIDVRIENRWVVTEKDQKLYRRYSGRAFDDPRYPGILECQFENKADFLLYESEF